MSTAQGAAPAAAAQGLGAAPAAPPAQVSPVFTIARNPGGAITGPLNLATDKVHITFYNGAIKGLEPRYNGDAKHLMAFLASVSAHSKIYNWANILTYGQEDFFKLYGTISKDDMRAKAATYSGAQVTRESQDSAMMALFLQNSVDTDLFSRLLNISHEYLVDNLPDGPLMLKTIISLVQVATNGDAMILALQDQLQNLRAKIKTYDSLIEFNAFVRETIQTLENYGVKPDATTIRSFLFGAYLEVEDTRFHDVMTRIHSDSRLGLTSAQDFHSLMHLAEEQYKIQITEKSWKTPSKTEAQIIALKAALASKEKKKTDGKSSPTSTIDGPTKTNENWRKTAPARGQKHTMKRGDKTYHWCGTHKSWTIHKPSECKLKSEGKGQGKSSKTPETPDSKTNNSADNKKTKTDKILARLATFGLSPEEIDDLFEE